MNKKVLHQCLLKMKMEFLIPGSTFGTEIKQKFNQTKIYNLRHHTITIKQYAYISPIAQTQATQIRPYIDIIYFNEKK